MIKFCYKKTIKTLIKNPKNNKHLKNKGEKVLVQIVAKKRKKAFTIIIQKLQKNYCLFYIAEVSRSV
jgi:hypothetical protein